MPDSELLMKLAERVAVLETRLAAVESSSSKNGLKLDALLEAATLGRGAWWMLVKIGMVLSLIFTFATTWWHTLFDWISRIHLK